MRRPLWSTLIEEEGVPTIPRWRSLDKVLFCSKKRWGEPIDLDPRKIKRYSSKFHSFIHNFDFIGCAYILELRDSQNYLFYFQISKKSQ